MFIENKYKNIYFKIIEKAKSQNRKKLKRNQIGYVYYELHHIYPSSIYPEYKDLKLNSWNGIYLTAKEHYICHLLLPKFLVGKDKHNMINALIKMTYSKSNGQERYTARSYGLVRSLIAEKNSEMFKGKPKSDETRKRMSLGTKGKKKSESHKLSMSRARKGLKTGQGNVMAQEENRKKVSDYRLLRCQVYNEFETIEILKADLQDYIDKGYKKGHPNLDNCKGKKWYKSLELNQSRMYNENQQPPGWIPGRITWSKNVESPS